MPKALIKMYTVDDVLQALYFLLCKNHPLKIPKGISIFVSEIYPLIFSCLKYHFHCLLLGKPKTSDYPGPSPLFILPPSCLQNLLSASEICLRFAPSILFPELLL